MAEPSVVFVSDVSLLTVRHQEDADNDEDGEYSD